jgi:soluble lytic murein transglycosylase-like protein
MFSALCRGRTLALTLLAALVMVPACAATGPGTAPPMSSIPGLSGGPLSESRVNLPQRQSRRAKPALTKPVPARRLKADSAALERDVIKRLAHRPLAMALSRRVKDPELADRVASAIVYEAGRARLSPTLLAGVLLIENAPFDTTAVSTEGAIGLMQVMPVHVGSYRCLSGDLINVEANICHGARLLSSYVRRGKSVEAGLRRYNGCVRGRNTPRCQKYPVRVLRTASRLRREMLASAAKLEPAAGDPTLSSSAIVTSSALPASVAPVANPPEVEVEALPDTSEQVQCRTLLGCLRRRWNSSR